MPDETRVPEEPTVPRDDCGNANDVYPLGYNDHEFARLERQGSIFREFTADVLRRAGLTAGMRVLDIGCGIGDVSLLAAELVAPGGAVLGVDRSPESIELAARRAADAGDTGHVSFVVGELDDFLVAQQDSAYFDAVVGRLVLMYQTDPVDTVRRLAGMVRAGGTIAFLEMAMPMFRSVPDVPLFALSIGRIATTLAQAGAEVDMGSRLSHVFVDAGLPVPTATYGGYAGSGPDSPVYAYVADGLRSVTTVAERLGIFTAAEVGFDTLVQRLAAEATERGACLMPPPLVGAWASRP